MIKPSFLPLLSLMLAVILTVGGVYATWTYSLDYSELDTEEIGITLSVFDYPPEEILPGGEMEDAELGGDHFALIDIILNEKDKSYGLNINNNVLLHQYLRKQKVVYSNQKVSGGNLKFILDPKNNTHNLYYCIEKISDTEYYCYTFPSENLYTAGTSGSDIVTYRTTLLKTDMWRATTSYLGYAKVKSLSSLGESADPNTIAYSIDVTTWHY
ncbi:MAG: hypothetical protein IJF14_05955 [Clostridia bacterium]|nr:hypothetical protein [Clostridia bacterium]